MIKKRTGASPETDWYQQAHELGDPFALDECVLINLASGNRLPLWASSELAERSLKRLQDLDKQLHRKFPKLPSIVGLLIGLKTAEPNRGGRKRSATDFISRKLLVGYSEAAREIGLRGGLASSCVFDRLADLGIGYEIKSIEKLYPLLRDALRPHPSLLSMWVSDLEDWLNEPRNRTKPYRVSSARKG